VLDAGHAASFQAAAVHKQRVKLDTAIGGEEASPTGVEGGVVFKDGYGCLNGVEGGAATGKDGVAGFKGGANARLVGGSSIGRNCPSATVNQKSVSVRMGGGHWDMVVHFAAGGGGAGMGMICSAQRPCQISGGSARGLSV
jgi:hypothetical protein